MQGLVPPGPQWGAPSLAGPRGWAVGLLPSAAFQPAAVAWLGPSRLCPLSRGGSVSGPRRVPSLKTTQGSLQFPCGTEMTETLPQTALCIIEQGAGGSAVRDLPLSDGELSLPHTPGWREGLVGNILRGGEFQESENPFRVHQPLWLWMMPLMDIELGGGRGRWSTIFLTAGDSDTC